MTSVIDFELNDEQRSLRDLAREFARNEIAPLADHYDRTAEFPWPVVQKAFDVGLMYASDPEQYGGAGIGALAEWLVAEELTRACAGISAAPVVGSLIASGLALAGSEEQQRRYFHELIGERKLVAYALTQSGPGPDAAASVPPAPRVGAP